MKIQRENGKSRCDVKKKKSFLRPRCKIAVKSLKIEKKKIEKT